VVETPVVLDVTAVAPSTSATFDTAGCGPVQVDVTVANTGLSPITCTVGALYLDSYGANWMEIGTQTILLTPGSQVVSFNWVLDGSVSDRSEIRRDMGVTPHYGSWEGLALKGMVLTPIATTGVDHFDELISGAVSIKHPGDGNGDGKVNYIDLGVIASAYGSEPGDGNWSPQADYDCSNKINYIDLGLIAANYGTTY
jgi:hypothetical protein